MDPPRRSGGGSRHSRHPPTAILQDLMTNGPIYHRTLTPLQYTPPDCGRPAGAARARVGLAMATARAAAGTDAQDAAQPVCDRQAGGGAAHWCEASDGTAAA